MYRLLSPLLFWLLFIPVAGAEQVNALYEAEVPVSGQGDGERRQALVQALETVFVKVTGYGEAATDPAIAGALEDPDRFVQQYRYRKAEPVILADGTTVPAASDLVFWARFDPSAIERLLRENALPIWGAARPATLVWLAVEQNGDRSLISANDLSPVRIAIEKQAQQRAIPVRLPLMDLQDQTRIQVADVWGEFRELISTASERYQTQAVLVGRLREDSAGSWQANWALYLDRDAQRWESVGSDLGKVVAAGVDGAANALSLRYAQFATQAGLSHFTVRVWDVSRMEDYVRARQYLEGVSGVESVQPLEVVDRMVSFRLGLKGTSYSVVQAIELGDLLVPANDADYQTEVDTNSGGSELSYRLLP